MEVELSDSVALGHLFIDMQFRAYCKFTKEFKRDTYDGEADCYLYLTLLCCDSESRAGERNQKSRKSALYFAAQNPEQPRICCQHTRPIMSTCRRSEKQQQVTHCFCYLLPINSINKRFGIGTSSWSLLYFHIFECFLDL